MSGTFQIMNGTSINIRSAASELGSSQTRARVYHRCPQLGFPNTQDYGSEESWILMSTLTRAHCAYGDVAFGPLIVPGNRCLEVWVSLQSVENPSFSCHCYNSMNPELLTWAILEQFRRPLAVEKWVILAPPLYQRNPDCHQENEQNN